MLFRTSYKMKPPVSARINPGHPLADKLIGCYLMNEGSGLTAFDSSGFRRNMPFGNSLVWSVGKLGPIILFDDVTSQYLITGTVSALAEPFSLVVWVYTDDHTVDGQVLLSIGDSGGSNSHSLRFAGEGDKIIAQSYDGSSHEAESSLSFVENVWYNVCGVFRASDERTIYVNAGNVVTSEADASVGDCDRYAVGVSADLTPYGYLSGGVALAMIYGRALADSEIDLLLRKPFCMFERSWRLAQMINIGKSI